MHFIMKSLPAEILITTFKHIDFKQKLECMLVCRAWAQVLLQGYLFETSHFSYPKKSKIFVNDFILKSFDNHFISLLKKINKGLYPGGRSKQLLIENKIPSSVNAALLATCFPNLTFFYSRINMIYNPAARHLRSATPEPDPFLGWRANLEIWIEKNNNRNMIFNVLKTGIFSRLTTLKVKHFSSEWIPHFKNAPALKNLSINVDIVLIENLEHLHSILPELTSLTLEGGLFSPLGQVELPKVIPAENIKTLRSENSFPFDLYSDTLTSYIRLKYTRINDFSCDLINPKSYGNIFSDSKFSEFVSTIGPGLKKCVVSLKNKSTATVDLFEKNMVQLETLGIDCFGCKDIFEKTRLNTKSSYIDQIRFNNKVQGLKSVAFRNFIQLKELILDLSYMADDYTILYRITFRDILDELPQTVNTLCLKSVNIAVDQENEPFKKYSNIATLKLYKVDISGERLSMSLAQHFPKLKSLILDRCNFNDSYSIELPNHHLNYVDFTPFEQSLYTTFSKTCFRVTIGNKSFYYKVPTICTCISYLVNSGVIGNRDSLRPALAALPKIDNDIIFFHFKCASLQTVYCTDHLLIR